MVAVHVAVSCIGMKDSMSTIFSPLFNAVPIPIDYRTVQLAARTSELLGVKAYQYVYGTDL